MTSCPACRPGWHNRMNAACAATAALAAGCGREAIARGLLVPRPAATHGGSPRSTGRTFYNDSTSTTPESTIAALESVGQAGVSSGRRADKGFDFTEMVEAIGRLAVGAAFFGEIGPKLHDRLKASHVDCVVGCRADARRGVGLVLALRAGRRDHALARLLEPRPVPQFPRAGERFGKMVEQLTEADER